MQPGGRVGRSGALFAVEVNDVRPASKFSHDVLGMGCTAVDDILYVPQYPPADGKVEVRTRGR